MRSRSTFCLSLALTCCIAFASGLTAHAQDASPTQDAPVVKRGRKYKAPPATSHIEVTVRKKFNGKPIMNAAVIFDSKKDGKDEGNLEVKTDPDGKATIDVIPTGSTVRVQVIATGFATFAEEYLVTESSREIEVSLLRPKEQVSDYVDNEGKTTTRKPGVQEPARTPPPTAQPIPAPPAPSTPPQQ
ncbi:carboxypeptidase regulatory-like domain-containing protein [Granulicella sp. L60]|uniref:carboxypeptidase regulatory-like domain-containing protein n=1 Tax=Granulicella sp. L60 TaxID=1641866 RepID=UPI00131A89FC|nr:carboxypeptidase regulatory-like domain-containing protein [Granulicella sp. L60]